MKLKSNAIVKPNTFLNGRMGKLKCEFKKKTLWKYPFLDKNKHLKQKSTKHRVI